jgi:hypothetical protein
VLANDVQPVWFLLEHALHIVTQLCGLLHWCNQGLTYMCKPKSKMQLHAGAQDAGALTVTPSLN